MPPRPGLAAKAGYKGEPVRILTSRQYDFHYNMALLMAEQLKRAGFKPELNVVDWATLVQRRNDPSCGTCTSRTPASSPSPCSRRRSWATARRAGGTRRPRRRR
jgi:ABC-type transport system substrate-binding protein